MQMADRRFRLFLSGRISGLRNRRRRRRRPPLQLNFNNPRFLINFPCPISYALSAATRL